MVRTAPWVRFASCVQPPGAVTVVVAVAGAVTATESRSIVPDAEARVMIDAPAGSDTVVAIVDQVPPVDGNDQPVVTVVPFTTRRRVTVGGKLGHPEAMRIGHRLQQDLR
jgi:hypothetical protein